MYALMGRFIRRVLRLDIMPIFAHTLINILLALKYQRFNYAIAIQSNYIIITLKFTYLMRLRYGAFS